MHHERRAYLLPLYAAQRQLAAMICFRAFTACGLGKEEWRLLVGMLCFGNQATIWVKSHIETLFSMLKSVLGAFCDFNHKVANFEAYPGSALNVFPCSQPPRLETVSSITWQRVRQ